MYGEPKLPNKGGGGVPQVYMIYGEPESPNEGEGLFNTYHEPLSPNVGGVFNMYVEPLMRGTCSRYRMTRNY